jgi:uncharacterized protein (DUF1697 family)
MEYIAFLRAINVSGQKIIKMEDLRSMFAMPGFKNIRTYIQSGNVLFESALSEEPKLIKKIEKQLHANLGYEVEVFVRSKDNISSIVKNNPFKSAELSKALKLYVNFLCEEPLKENKQLLESFSNDLEQFSIKGREVYALCLKDTNEKLKYSNKFVEKKLKMLATGRDWNTINRILDL